MEKKKPIIDDDSIVISQDELSEQSMVDLDSILDSDEYELSLVVNKKKGEKKLNDKVINTVDEEVIQFGGNNNDDIIEVHQDGKPVQQIFADTDDDQKLNDVIQKLTKHKNFQKIILEKKQKEATTKIKLIEREEPVESKDRYSEYINDKQTALNDLTRKEVNDVKAISLSNKIQQEQKVKNNRPQNTLSQEKKRSKLSMKADPNDEDNKPEVKKERLKIVGNENKSRGKNSDTIEHHHTTKEITTEKKSLEDRLTSHMPSMEVTKEESVSESFDKRIYHKKKKGFQNNFFFRSTNHQELYSVGSSYYNDYLNGCRNFGFAGSESIDSRHKAIVGISSFIKYQEDLNILIISLGIRRGFLNECLNNSDKMFLNFDSLGGESVPIYKGDGLYLIDFRDLIRLKSRCLNTDFENITSEVTDDFDIIMWDIPNIEEYNRNREHFFPVIMSLDNVSFVISPEKTKAKNIEKLKDLFVKYGIYIKGALVDSIKKSGKKKKGNKNDDEL